MPIYLCDRTCYSGPYAAIYDYQKEGNTMEVMVDHKRAAAYCRVSTGMECQEGSYETQIKYYKDLISNDPDEELVKSMQMREVDAPRRAVLSSSK